MIKTTPADNTWDNKPSRKKSKPGLKAWRKKWNPLLKATPVGHMAYQEDDRGVETGYLRTTKGWGKRKQRMSAGYLESLMKEAAARGY